MLAFTPVPPLGGHPLLIFLLQLGLLLLVATLMGMLARRLSMPALVGELLTGVLLGPSLLGSTAPAAFHYLFPQNPEQVHMLDAFGQVGVLLLVAITGLQLDLKFIRRHKSTAAKVSLPGFVIPLTLGVGAGLLVPVTLLAPGSDQATFAVFIGVAMSVSAIPVIAKTLIDLNMLHRNVGQMILMTGTVDDLLGWIGLSVVTAMATTGLRAAGIGLALAYLIGVIVAAFLLRPLVRKLMLATLRNGEAKMTLAAAVAVIMLFSIVTHQLHLEAIFGALLAGMLIRSGGPEVMARLLPIRAIVAAVLAPIFFATAGLRMDLTALADPDVLTTAAALLVIAIVGKFTGAFIGARLSRLNRWEAMALGAGMNSRGVIEVVIAMVGVRLGVLTPAMYTCIVLIAVVTSLMGPPILRYAVARLEPTAEERLRERENDPVPSAVGVPSAVPQEVR